MDKNMFIKCRFIRHKETKHNHFRQMTAMQKAGGEKIRQKIIPDLSFPDISPCAQCLINYFFNIWTVNMTWYGHFRVICTDLYVSFHNNCSLFVCGLYAVAGLHTSPHKGVFYKLTAPETKALFSSAGITVLAHPLFFGAFCRKQKRTPPAKRAEFFSRTAFLSTKHGGGGESRTHVLLGCQKTFYILSLPIDLNGAARTDALRAPQGTK